MRAISELITGIFLIGLLLMSCGQPRESLPEAKGSKTVKADDPVIDANQSLARIEETEIEAFIRRYEWDMQSTESGLRYMIYHQGYGVSPESGDKVMLNYQLSLINGKVCYSSEESGQKIFRVGMAEVEKGLHEAVLLLKVGDKAKLILPSALGFGLMGDQDCIPRHATLIYDIELTGVIKE
jgi:FKBP-type peptidyl-prolyl cis-trans isomerase